jgi:small subunit ribosomal protein S17
VAENTENNAPENVGLPVEESPETAAPRWDKDEGQIQDPQSDRNSRKERVGVVVSDAADKTITVKVERLVRHKKYKKRVRRSKKFMAHDEENVAKVGDTVRIVETRPLSARKRWRLARVVTRAE